MAANPIWIAAYGGPPPAAIGAAKVWIAPGDGSVPSAAASWIAGYGGPVAGASPVWIAGYGGPIAGATPITLVGFGGSGGSGGGATSVWSAADATANGMTLSNGGLTVVNPVAASGWISLRSSIAKSSGKLYVEFAVDATISTSASQMIGLASAAFNIASYLGNSNYSCAMWASTDFVSPGFTSNYDFHVQFGANNVIGLAIDFTAGNIWISVNGVWFNSSNPATGSLPIISFVPATVGALFAGMSFSTGPANGVWTLQATAASQHYAPPSGFTAWG